MADADLGPTTSYSDPFYDRLDAVFTVIKRSWPLVLLAIAVLAAGIVLLTWALQRHPQAGSATRFVIARDLPDDDQRKAAFLALADDQSVVPAFRARARIEVVNLMLAKGDTASAGPAAAKAVADAALGDDQEVQLMARLSAAAAHLQAKEYDAAATDYAAVKRAAGAKRQVASLEAGLGLARTLEAQGKLDDAIAELEPLTSRNDEGGKYLLDLARVAYWDLKRQVAEAKLPKAEAPASTPATAAATAPAAPAPAVAAVPAPAPASAVATPAATK